MMDEQEIQELQRERVKKALEWVFGNRRASAVEMPQFIEALALRVLALEVEKAVWDAMRKG